MEVEVRPGVAVVDTVRDVVVAGAKRRRGDNLAFDLDSDEAAVVESDVDGAGACCAAVALRDLPAFEIVGAG